MSLYNVTSEMQALLTMLEAGEVSSEDLKDTIESVELEWNERADAVISAIKNLISEAEAIRGEEIALAARRKRKESAAERLKEYLTASMQALGKPKYESPRHAVSFRKSYRINITDEDALLKWARINAPDIVKEGKPSVSKESIKALIGEVNVPFVTADEINNIQIK